MAQKRPFNEGKRHFKKNKKQKKAASDGSNEEVLLVDVRHLLEKTKIADEKQDEPRNTPEHHTEVELSISELSSTGDGLASRDGHVYVVPFAAPGDSILARVYKTFEEERYSLADFVTVLSPSEHRTETPRCPYFTRCSGCQFQHLPYAFQLAHKRRIVERAFRNFSNLSEADVPPVGETIGSPLHYGYRTKLTPHFEGPPGGRRDRRNGEEVKWAEVPPIGFMKKGTRKTMDIEDCPIGTEAVRLGMKRERKRVGEEIEKYQRGATLLLRESTKRVAPGEAGGGEEDAKNEVREDRGEHVHVKTCITEHKAISTEYVDDYRFDNPAGSFFQNNNSILPLVTQYIRDNILGLPRAPTSIRSGDDGAERQKIHNMIDAYCGSGFFTVSLSSLFRRSIGIDISPQSIDFASRNAELNRLPADSAHFIAADATDLFASVDEKRFPPAETVVVIDPPRKGCDDGFIQQLMAYGPERICYVSCNVHTQARDVGLLVSGGKGGERGEGKGMYEIESLRGFDFFPQTSHVEGVAILRRRRQRVGEDADASKQS